MGYANPQSLVSTEWLAQHLNAPDVRVVDASWYMPQLGRDPKAEFNEAHIPGAVFFDIDELQKPLEDYLQRRQLLPAPKSNAVFLNGRDLGPLSPRAVQLRLKTLARQLDLPNNLTPHALRHTYATLAIERGANIKAVSQLLGHADVKTTLQLYTHLSTEHLHEVFRLCHPLRDNRRELPEIINDRKKMIPYLRA